MKSQINFRAAPVTQEQLAELQEWRGQKQTELIAIALEQLWQRENKKRNPPTCEGCGKPLELFTTERWLYRCNC